MVDDRHPVAELVRLIQVVRREEDRGPPFSQQPELLPQVRPVLRVQAGRGLVEKQHLRPVHDPERDLQPAPLAARVGANGPVGERLQVEHRDELGAAPPGVGGAQSVQSPREKEVLPPCRFLVGPAELPDVADPPPDKPRCAKDVGPSDQSGARIGGQQGGEDAQGRRLTRAIWPEQPEDLPRRNSQVDAADGLNGRASDPERLAQPGDLDSGHWW